MKFANLDVTPKEINEEQHTLKAVFSTGDVDRHGEIVDQKSWILNDFLKNPVVLFGHDHSQPPVGKIVTLSYNDEGNLEGEVKFAANEYPFARVIWNLYKGGFMKAFSVGFSAGKVDTVGEQVILRENVLYEISTVSVPANALALAKSKGLDVTALEHKIAEQEDSKNDAVVPTDEVVDKDDDEVNETNNDNDVTVDAEEKDCDCQPAQLNTEVVEADEPESAAEGATDESETPPAESDNAENDEEIVEDAVESETDEFEKALQDIVTDVKEGRVLSKRNRATLVDAIAALQAVLDADSKDEDKSVEDAVEKDVLSTTVNIPAISISKKKAITRREINKAIRTLLKEKKSR